LKSKTPEGISVLTVFSRSPSIKWVVVLGMPLDEVTAGLRQTLFRLSVATCTALVIELTLAWFMGGRIAKSITDIGKSTLALSSGQQLEIPRLHFKGAIELSRALREAESVLQKARYDAHHDALTGLKNRTLFHLLVDQQLALCMRNKTALAIFYIDLDGFKAVNDTHGHVFMLDSQCVMDNDEVSRITGQHSSLFAAKENTPASRPAA
jgi:predicted signal transduction protein with EAL and GGDEF domain